INNIDPSGGWAASGIFEGMSRTGIMATTTIGGAIIGGAADALTGGDGLTGVLMGAGMGLGSGTMIGIGSSSPMFNLGIKALSFGPISITTNNQDFTLKDVLNFGKGSTRFTY